MNTPNNKRRKQSRERMEAVFVQLLQTKPLNRIRVSEICQLAGVNRTTFYANYADIYALADAIRERLENNLQEMYEWERTQLFDSHDYLKLFRHIKDNQLLYQTYFKLGYDNDYKIISYDTELAQAHFQNRFVQYHMEFFRAGITRIIKMWLENGCMERPEEMFEIIQREYLGRSSVAGDA